MTGTPAWAWAAAVGVICGLLAIDMLSTRRQPGMSRTVLLSAVWVGAGIGFGVILTLWQGFGVGQQYFGAYLIEKSLSVDNLFVFAAGFRAFAVPAASQHRVLLAGVAGAFVLRGAFIAAGAALINHLSWAFPAFGGLLLIAAVRMARRGAPPDPRRGLVLRGLRKVVPVSDDYDGTRFITRIDGKRVATPLIVALVAIATTDVIFALDSIPAAFGVTTDAFLVFTSNAFAILGLRALYFLLAGALERFRYLGLGLAVLLAFIGAKMILSPVLHIPTAVSLGAIIVIIVAAGGMSMWNRPRVTHVGQAGSPARPRPRAWPSLIGDTRTYDQLVPARCLFASVLPGRGFCPGPGRDPAGAAERDRRDRPWRRHGRQLGSQDRGAGDAGGLRGVPRRQRQLPDRPPFRPCRPAAILRQRARGAQAGLGQGGS